MDQSLVTGGGGKALMALAGRVAESVREGVILEELVSKPGMFT